MEIETVVICCGTCGTTFMIPRALDVRYRDSHQKFYCPNGHTLSYPQQTKLDLQKNVSRNRQVRIEELEAENRRLKQKSAVKKDVKQGGK